MVARDRNGQTFTRKLNAVNSDLLSRVLSPLIAKGSVLCTDGNPVYLKVSEVCGTLHKQLNISKGIKVLEKTYHIQNVNAYDSRLKSWIKRFHGVATKYLQKYLGWWRTLDTWKNIAPSDFLKKVVSKVDNNTRVRLL